MLEIGSKAPEFILPDQNGDRRSLFKAADNSAQLLGELS